MCHFILTSPFSGQDVKFLYEFSKVSVNHRVLTRNMQRGMFHSEIEVYFVLVIQHTYLILKLPMIDSSFYASTYCFIRFKIQGLWSFSREAGYILSTLLQGKCLPMFLKKKLYWYIL